MTRRTFVPVHLLAEHGPRRLAGRPRRAGGGRCLARRRRCRYRPLLIRPELGGHVPHAPGHDDEKEHPGPRRDRRRRLGAFGLERFTRSARERVDKERNAPPHRVSVRQADHRDARSVANGERRSEEHTSELQSPCNLVCRLLLEKKKKPINSSQLLISYEVSFLKKKLHRLCTSPFH